MRLEKFTGVFWSEYACGRFLFCFLGGIEGGLML